MKNKGTEVTKQREGDGPSTPEPDHLAFSSIVIFSGFFLNSHVLDPLATIGK